MVDRETFKQIINTFKNYVNNNMIKEQYRKELKAIVINDMESLDSSVALSIELINPIRAKLLDLFKKIYANSWSSTNSLVIEASLRTMALHWPKQNVCAFSNQPLNDLSNTIPTMDGYLINKNQLPLIFAANDQKFEKHDMEYFVTIAEKNKTIGKDAAIPGLVTGFTLSVLGAAVPLIYLLAVGAISVTFPPLFPLMVVAGLVLTGITLFIEPMLVITPLALILSPFVTAGAIGYGIGGLINKYNGRPAFTRGHSSEDMEKLDELIKVPNNQPQANKSLSTTTLAKKLNMKKLSTDFTRDVKPTNAANVSLETKIENHAESKQSYKSPGLAV